MQTIKLVVVGDGDSGKHEFLLTYTGTVFDRYAVTVIVGGETYTLGITYINIDYY
uniref:Uncharacterized protein n=1 Tax=Astatotilapia calliptera TaxID=8154 RepID=A0A3P8Q1C4_ASTCA